MEENKNPKSKVIFEGLISNNNHNLIRTKTLKLNFGNSNSTRNIKKLLNRKKISSAPFIKRYNIDKFKYYYNSDKEIQANNFNKKNLRLYSLINISTPFNKNIALYKNLKIEVFHKNFGRTPRNINLSLFKNITTNYLKQKESDNIPILYPFYSSFNNKYESKSQRERYIKNLDKIVQVQTHLANNKTDHYKIISEFMVKNGVNEIKYLNAESFQKMENYLRKPINFNPNLTMTQIIKNIINNKTNNVPINSRNKKIDLKSSNFIKPQKSEKIIIKKNVKLKENRFENNNININDIINLKKSSSSPNFNFKVYQNDSRINRLGKKYGYLSDKNNLNLILDNLEDELKKIKTDKINRIEENNKFNDNKTYLLKTYEDKNKFVPNLCLSSKGFSERYKNNIDKFNNKIKNIMSKNEKIKSINKRMYYESKQTKKLREFDLSDIRKYHKITELVVLNRGRQEMLKRKIKSFDFNENNKNSNLLNKVK